MSFNHDSLNDSNPQVDPFSILKVSKVSKNSDRVALEIFKSALFAYQNRLQPESIPGCSINSVRNLFAKCCVIRQVWL